MKKLLLFLCVLAYADLYDTKDYAKAYPVLKKECNKDNANSCYKLGKMNEFGLGTGISYSYAYKYYKKSCDLNNKEACGELGKMYYLGLGVEKNIKKANELLENACKNDVYSACDSYAYLQKTEYKVFKQDELLKACNGGIASSCVEIADKISPIQGIDLYLRACGLGDDLACQMAANWYITSQAVNNKIANFSELSNKECKNNNYKACNSIANVYRNLNNIEKAKEYYDLACKLDDSNSCSSLAVIQEQSKEFELGIKNYEKACGLKDSYSCARLGFMYKEGLKDNDKTYIKENASKSKKYFKQACELGNTRVCE